MDNNISRIGSSYFKPEYKIGEDKGQEKNAQNQEQTKEKQQEKQVSSNEVLGFMAAQSADMAMIVAPKTLDPAKYVTSEQEAGIEDIMNNFEANFEKAFAIAKDEFPDASDELLRDLALAYINASF